MEIKERGQARFEHHKLQLRESKSMARIAYDFRIKGKRRDGTNRQRLVFASEPGRDEDAHREACEADGREVRSTG